MYTDAKEGTGELVYHMRMSVSGTHIQIVNSIGLYWIGHRYREPMDR